MNNETSEKDLELLSAWLDGACDDPDALRARLRAEPALALRLRQLQAVRARLAALTPPRISEDFAARVTARAYARRLPAPTRRFWYYAVPAAAAALLLVVAGLSRTPSRQASDPAGNDAWQMALNALAESPDEEFMAEWGDEEPALEEATPGELVGMLAELSAGELDGAEFAEMDHGGSVIDLLDELDDVEAAVLAARLKSGA